MMLQLIIFAGIAVMLTGIGQILLKYGALPEKKSCYFPEYLEPYLNRYTLSGYCLLLVSTVISVYILKEIPLKLYFPFFVSINMIVVVVLSCFILHEFLTHRRIVAIGVIILGVLVVSIP